MWISLVHLHNWLRCTVHTTSKCDLVRTLLKSQYLLVRLSSSCLRLLPSCLVPSIFPSILPSITCSCSRCSHYSQRLFCLLYVGFLSTLTLRNTSFLKRSVQLISVFLQHYIWKVSTYLWHTLRSTEVRLFSIIHLQENLELFICDLFNAAVSSPYHLFSVVQ